MKVPRMTYVGPLLGLLPAAQRKADERQLGYLLASLIALLTLAAILLPPPSKKEAPGAATPEAQLTSNH